MAESLSNRVRGKDRVIDKGHGSEALGPSESSDTGSDAAAAPGIKHAIGQDIKPDRIVGTADPGGEIPRPWRRRPGANADLDFSDSEAGEAQEPDEGEQPVP